MKKYLAIVAAAFLSGNTFAQSHSQISSCDISNTTAVYVIDISGPCSSTTSPSMIIADWTSSAVHHVWRQYFKTDLSFIDTNAVIDSATLSLYANPNSPSGYTGSPTYGTNNAVGIYRVTGPWDTTTLTWATQPAYTHADSALLPQSTSPVQNYVADVTNLIQGIVTAHANYGFVFKHLQETTHYNSMIFYSPNGGRLEPPVVPVLFVKWHLHSPEGIVNITEGKIVLVVHPNPASGQNVTVDLKGVSKEGYTFTITDITGRLVNTYGTCLADKVTIETDKLAKGVYLLSLKDKSGTAATEKLVVE